MGKQINQYTKTRTKIKTQSDDLIDLDSTEDSGVTFESAKIKVSEFVAYIVAQLPPITMYVVDGTILANRTITALTRWTKWKGGDVIVEMADAINDYGFAVNDSTSTEKARMGYDQATNSGFLKIDNNDLYVNDGFVGIGTDTPNEAKTKLQIKDGKLNIETPPTIHPISLYQNQVGGATNGMANIIRFYANDSNGDKTGGSSIITRINGTPTVGNVNMSMIINDNLKVRADGNVLIRKGAATYPVYAQLNIQGTAGSSATSILVQTSSSNYSTVPIEIRNSNNKRLMRMSSDGITKFNENQISTADFRIYGLTNSNLFYTDASRDNIGVGTATPNSSAILDVVSENKGFATPRMTTAQRDGISSPIEGLEVYNLTTHKKNFYNGTIWEQVTSA